VILWQVVCVPAV